MTPFWHTRSLSIYLSKVFCLPTSLLHAIISRKAYRTEFVQLYILMNIFFVFFQIYINLNELFFQPSILVLHLISLVCFCCLAFLSYHKKTIVTKVRVLLIVIMTLLLQFGLYLASSLQISLV